MRGRSINFYLMDGTPTGRIKCTLANWTGLAYRIPRNDLDLCKERSDLKQSGVYFLFGETDQTEDSVVYIGQAGARKNGEGILYRLQEHKRDESKDYWTEAVVFTTSNNSFGPTEISYLENRFRNMAVSVKRYIVKNGNDPTSGNVTEEKESELEEFIDNAKIVMGSFGYKLFVPLLQIPELEPKSMGTISETDQEFSITRSGANAKSRVTNEGIVVLSGSQIRIDLVPSCPDSTKNARKKNAEFISESGILLKNILFRTPSGAAAFVLGAPVNGNLEWKTSDGLPLKDVT